MRSSRRLPFTVAERKTLVVFAVLMVAIGAGLVMRAPKGAGQVLAVGLILVIAVSVGAALYLLRSRAR